MVLMKQNKKIIFSEDICNYDVIIKCVDRDIFTHRMILAAVSSWFREIITLSDTDEIILTIIMKDFQSSDILSFLDFVYGKQDFLEKSKIFYDLHIDVMNPIKTTKTQLINDYESPDDNKVNFSEQIWITESSSHIKKEEIKIKEEAFEDSMEVDDGYSNIELNLKDEVDFQPTKLKKASKKDSIKKSSNLVPTLMNIECKMCSLSFTEQESFAEHCRKEHDFNYSCDLCKFVSIKTMAKLMIHRARAHGIGEDRKCKFCDYTTKLKYNMVAHVKRMHSGITYQCDKCDYKASEKKSLKMHIAAKHENKIYHCDQCTYTAVTAQALKQHKLKVHEGVVTKFPCDQCDTVLSSKGSLKVHIQAKHREREYLCDKCDYIGGTKTKLKLHVKTHHEGFMYECKECDFKCKGNTTFTVHRQKVHKGVTYPCQECDHVASSAGRLREHRVRKHGLESKWKCEICGHRSSIESYLKRHIREKHEGIPYKYKPKNKQKEEIYDSDSN